MKGILRSALLFCFAWRLQRVFLGASVLLSVVTPWVVGMVRPSPSVVTNGSMVSDLLSSLGIWGTVCIGSVTFRATSAPRTLRLLPYARLQLMLGVLLAEVLLASFVTLNIELLQRVAGPSAAYFDSVGGAFVSEFLMISLTVFWLFFFFGGSRRGRWLAEFVLLVIVAALVWHERLFLVLHQMGVAGLASAAILAWTLFAMWYLRARRIGPPATLTDGWGTAPVLHSKAIEPRHAALKIYLLGRASILRAGWPDAALLLAFNAVSVVSVFAFPTRAYRSPLALSFVLTVTFLGAGAMGLMRTCPIAQRARALWIRSGYSRWELFKTAERLSLLYLACLGIPALVVSSLEWMVLPHGSADWTYLLSVGLAMVVCDVYFGLAGVKRSSPSPWVVIGPIALDVVILVPDGRWFSWGVSSPHVLILATEILLAVALRFLAQWRWQRIDWLICKPAPISAQAMRPAV